jgi:hypothetical protein
MRQINLIYATTTVDQGLYWNLKAGKAWRGSSELCHEERKQTATIKENDGDY